MSKPQPRRIPGDECPVSDGGTVYHPHEGEWVEMIGVMSVGELKQISALGELGSRIKAAEGDPDEREQIAKLINGSFDVIVTCLADRVTAWNWTNLRGQPIVPWNDEDADGKPFARLDGSTAPFEKLSADELYWLLTAAKGETPEQEGKGSRPSRTTSSASAPRRNRTN